MALEWTTLDDVKDRWLDGDFPTSDATLGLLLEDAEDAILGEFPDIQTRINRDEGTDTTEGPSVPLRRVTKVAARIVTRHLRNPHGERSRQEVQGPFAQNVVYGGDSPGALYLTAEDRAELGGRRLRSAFMVNLFPAASTTPAPSDWEVYP